MSPVSESRQVAQWLRSCPIRLFEFSPGLQKARLRTFVFLNIYFFVFFLVFDFHACFSPGILCTARLECGRSLAPVMPGRSSMVR